MSYYVKYFPILVLSLFIGSAQAKKITCPPAEQIMSAKFVRAIPYDKTIFLWEMISVPFMHDGVLWDVSFGMELPNVTDANEAVRVGQMKYNDVKLTIKSPEADPIPGYLFCDYTHTGMEYWVQALSPPGE